MLKLDRRSAQPGYVGARRIINGQDKADEIAVIADRLEAALRKSLLD